MVRPIALVLAAFFGIASATAQEDLRVRYGTDDLQAAREAHRGLGLASAGKHREALAAFEAALKADPKCGFAHFQRAMALGDLGEIEKAMLAYKDIFAPDVRTGRNIRATGATNLGILFGKLGQYDESNLWFSRAVVEDYDNEMKERGKAYRNMAINLRAQKRHLPAAVAMALAYQDKAKNCDMATVRDFFQRVPDSEDACRLLAFDDAVAEAKARKEPADVTELEIDGNPRDAISEFLPDPSGKFVIALSPAAGQYHVIGMGDKPSVKSLEAKGLVAGCLMGGRFYVSRQNPNRVEEVAIETGKPIKAHPFAKAAPKSFTAFPVQNRIYFSADAAVHEYDMATGEVRETNTPGTVVTGHPNQKYVYSFSRPQKGGGSGLVVVDGRVLEVRRQFDWIQCPLFKSVVTPGGLLLAEIRDNAASNGQRLALSPDGNWVGVVGGGGYRPSDKAAAGGYGAAVFNAMDTERPQGFFKSDAYPNGLCVNHVAGVVVSVRGADFRVSNLSDAGGDAKPVKGDWNGACTWTGDGRTLLLANSKGGFTAYRMELTRDEEKFAAEWPAKVQVKAITGKQKPSATQILLALKTFEVPEKPTAETVINAIDRAAAKGRSAVLTHWAEHPDYEKNKAATEEIIKAIQANQNGRSDDLAITLLRLTRAEKASPNHPLLLMLLGQTQSRRAQPAEAEKYFLAAVREDAGRSDVTVLSLIGQSTNFDKGNQPLHAIHCLVTALEVDRANPAVIARAVAALTKAKMEAEAARVKGFATATGPESGSGPTAVAALPSLHVAKDAKKLTAEEIYARSAKSVVMIRNRNGSGSGVCIGRGDVVLTNAHVVDRDDEVEVFTYKFEEKKLVRNPALKGKVIFRSEDADLAIVQLEKVGLTPMEVSAESPAAGARVFAIGSPGLGRDVLEQSISEGLVSSPSRKLDEKVFIQHSAAVNPGNSGGPLLDERGCVVGIVTLKAKLENVGFAVPVETFRKLFPEAKK